MEDGENSAGALDSLYNKLVSQEDFGVDEHPLYSHQETQKVSLSMVRPNFSHYKRLIVGLSVLAAILLVADIGLGIYYNSGQHTIRDIGREVTKLQASYNAAIQSRDEVKKQLAEEISEQQHTKWELEHQKRRGKDYEAQADRIKMEIAALESHMPLIKDGCRHCLPGWTFMNSMCYYFAFSESLSKRSWLEARQFCIKQGGDLAVIDSRDKQMFISGLITNYQDPSRHISQSGFWIGLRDVDEEGVWRWLDGTRLAEGYWNDGEPNNVNNEDCAAIYPRANPYKAWNDAPCSYSLKWICEKASSSTS